MRRALAFWALYNERLLLAVLFTLVLCVAGCTPARDDERASRLESAATLVVYTDPETKCQYLRGRNREGLTPRMAADGKQICGDRK